MRVQDVIVESSEITQLRESTHKELYRQLLLLEKSFNQPMKIGNAYIPVPVYVIQDHVDTFNKSYETPNGEFCTLLKINADTLEFKNKAGTATTKPVTIVAYDGVLYFGCTFEKRLGNNPSRLMLIQIRGCPI